MYPSTGTRAKPLRSGKPGGCAAACRGAAVQDIQTTADTTAKLPMAMQVVGLKWVLL
jgi:hypothetical protein